MFLDRADAGRQLALALSRHADTPGGLVVALPRGGIIIGYEVSRALRLPLEVFIVRKIGYPGNPECACAALAETGVLKLTEESHDILGVTNDYLDRCVGEQREEIQYRTMLYRGGLSMPPVEGRTLFLVDDGLATGATFGAAIHALQQLKPSRLVGAVPVAPPETVQRLRPLLSELVVLEIPEYFHAVGESYQDFKQVEDEQVVRLLRTARNNPHKASNLRDHPT